MNQRRYVILTPFAQSEVVAGVLRLRGFDAAVIPTSTGTVVARDLPVPTYSDWDMSELLGPDTAEGEAQPSEPAKNADSGDVSDDPDAVAAALSKLSKYGVVLMITELGEDVGLESGVSGLVQAHRVMNGQRTEELSAGLILNTMDEVVEDLLLGRDITEIKGVIEREDVTPSFLERFFGRGARKRGGPVEGGPEDGGSSDADQPDREAGESPNSNEGRE